MRLQRESSKFLLRPPWLHRFRCRCYRSEARSGLRLWDASLRGWRGPGAPGSPAGNRACLWTPTPKAMRSEEHTSELQSHSDLGCRLLLGKKNNMQLLKGIIRLHDLGREPTRSLTPAEPTLFTTVAYPITTPGTNVVTC